MKISILTIGDEICIGQIENTNASHIARACVKTGADVVAHSSVGDDLDQIVSEINRLTAFSDALIISGGLGPTHDDKTKEALLRFFDDKLVLHAETSAHVRDFFERRGIEIAQVNLDQALVPSKSVPLRNPVGTAPGMMFESDEKLVFSIPGVPDEMKYVLYNSIIPKIKEYIANNNSEVTLHNTLLTSKIGESALAELIGDVDDFLKNSSLAYLPSYRGVRLRISASGKNFADCESKISRFKEFILNKAGNHVVSEDDDDLGALLAEKMRKSGKTVSVAESCTGGMLGAAFTDYPGSSEYFIGGVIAYSNDIKINVLGVSKKTIEKFGAVSEECSKEMALNVKEKFKSDYGISITGVAGPSGGSPQKPVGTVWMGFASEKSVFAEKFVFGTEREPNRKRSVGMAQSTLLELLNNKR